MENITIKKSTSIKVLWLILSIAYGFFTVFIINNHYILNKGDVVSIVMNLEELDSLNGAFQYYGNLENILSNGDAVFRVLVFVIRDILSLTNLGALGILAFMTSLITIFIYFTNIREKKYLFFLIFLFLIVFCTPRVNDLFTSGIRSGLAFTILLIALLYLKGVKQYILFLLSILIHLSMGPIIAFYVLFNFIEKTRVNLSFLTSIFLLLLCSFFISMITPMYEFAYSTGVNQSSLYMFLVVCLGLLITFTTKKVIRNVYGFISIGLILIVLLGYLIFDFSFVRYIGNAIIFYLLFVIKEGNIRTLSIFTISYTPFFLLTLYYSIANYW